MPLGDFDHKVLLYIRDAGETVTMNALVQNFGEPVRSTVESLCKERFLYWDRPIDNIWGHDDAKSKIEITASGGRELNNFVESERLTTRAKWRERFWTVAFTISIECVLWFFTHLDTIAEFFQSLRAATGT